MKRMLLTLVLSLTLCTLSSCKYNVSKNKDVSREDVTEFIKDMKNPFYESDTSFVYSEYEEVSSYTKYEKYKNVVKYEIYGTLDKSAKGEVHYDAKKYQKSVTSTLNGKEKNEYNYKEIGNLFIRDDSDDNKTYFIIDLDVKIPDGKIKQETLKSTLKEDSIFYNNIKKTLSKIIDVLHVSYMNDLHDYDTIVPIGSFYYISNNKLKVVSSSNTTHVEEVFVFDDGILSSYKYTSKEVFSTSNYGIREIYTEKELQIKNTREVKVPRDAEYYKTEIQKFVPGFFDYISVGTILIILAVNLIIGAAVFVLIRILRRPKFVE